LGKYDLAFRKLGSEISFAKQALGSHAWRLFRTHRRQTSVATKNVAANELTWFAIEAAE
jgi:hypothetical protein